MRCPGCGAYFQTTDPSKPGYYLIKSKNEKSLSPSLTLKDDVDDIDKPKKSLDKDDLNSLISMMDEDTIKQFLICQRCINLRHYNRSMIDLNKDDEESRKMKTSLSSLATLSQAQANERSLRFLRNHNNEIVLIVIDIFDFPNSLIKDLDNLIGRSNQTVLIANKIDLLPSTSSLLTTGRSYLMRWIRSQCSKMGLRNLEDIYLISAKKNVGVKRLFEYISSLRYINSNVYLVGYTNVGKSELINSFLRRIAQGKYPEKGNGDGDDNKEIYEKYKLTSSFIPGTTINIKIKSSKSIMNYLYDTPGIVNNNQLINYLNENELKLTTPQKLIKPLTYTLHPGRSLLFGGFGKIDYVEGSEKPIQLTIVSRIPIHIASIDRSFEYFKEMSEQGKQTILKPPIGSSSTSSDRIKSWPKLVKCINKFSIGKNNTTGVIFKDIVFSGVGWASIEFQSHHQQRHKIQHDNYNNIVKSGEKEEENIPKLNVWAIDRNGVYVRDQSIFPYKNFKKTIVKYTGNSINKWE
ncbi:8447_t:CDS:2, partial [Entrophospora sp. SA101]